MRQTQRVFSLFLLSPSSRRAWIEISHRNCHFRPSLVALLAEGVDRNFCTHAIDSDICWSPSSRRAWIEIRSTV